MVTEIWSLVTIINKKLTLIILLELYLLVIFIIIEYVRIYNEICVKKRIRNR
jgi:hypothetical protein